MRKMSRPKRNVTWAWRTTTWSTPATHNAKTNGMYLSGRVRLFLEDALEEALVRRLGRLVGGHGAHRRPLADRRVVGHEVAVEGLVRRLIALRGRGEAQAVGGHVPDQLLGRVPLRLPLA